MKKMIIIQAISLVLVACSFKNDHKEHLKNGEFIYHDSSEITIDLSKFKNLRTVKFIGNENLAYQSIKVDEKKSISYLYNYKKIHKKGLELNTWLSFTQEGLMNTLDKCHTYEVTFEKETENSHILNVHFPTDLIEEYPCRVYFGDFDDEYNGNITDTIPFNPYGRARARILNLKKGRKEFLFIIEVGEFKRPKGKNEKILIYGRHVEMIE